MSQTQTVNRKKRLLSEIFPVSLSLSRIGLTRRHVALVKFKVMQVLGIWQLLEERRQLMQNDLNWFGILKREKKTVF